MGDDQILCSLCRQPAVWRDRETGSHLCSLHLKESVENRVAEMICTAGPLPDRVGVAFSGGKDSTALLAAMTATQDHTGIRLIALTVDEGIGGYREETIRHAAQVCSVLGVEHRIISFPDLFGYSLDKILQQQESRACTVCGILRRRALEILAEEEGIRLLATGHNQDDHAQTALMNAFSADLKKVCAGTGPSLRYARRIKPFARVSEREVTLYAILAGLFTRLPECPYAGGALRNEVRSLLNRFEQQFPGSMRNAAACEAEIRSRLSEKSSGKGLVPCRICGWPGTGEICQVCTLLGAGWARSGGDRPRDR